MLDDKSQSPHMTVTMIMTRGLPIPLNPFYDAKIYYTPDRVEVACGVGGETPLPIAVG